MSFNPINEVVYITKGRYRGRIGYCDDDEEKGTIVYFGPMFVTLHYKVINFDYLVPVNTELLMKRRSEIVREIRFGKETKGKRQHYSILEEYMLIVNTLNDRMIDAMFMEAKCSTSVFISYSSKDQKFAKWLAVDLKSSGYDVWLDEWSILVGESIPQGIQVGIEKCQFVIVILSKHSVKSKWVEREWQAKYWQEVEDGKINVLPAMIEKCEVPPLLRVKKYANFIIDYSKGLEEIKFALRKLV